MKKFDFQELFDIIQAKINSKDKNSYTKKLAGDSNLLKRKIIEESGEVITAQTKQELIWEFADIFYFLMVFMALNNITFEDINKENERRDKETLLNKKSFNNKRKETKMTNEPVKGFSDYAGEVAEKRKKIKEILEKTFEVYGFNPAETPIVEYEEFVVGENSNDEAVSDRYKLEDKGKRKLALRYEFTFQLKRLAQNKKLPYRRYQIGPVFRDEPTSSNRVRQITQCDIDVISSSLKDEAEILKAFSEVLDKLGIEFTIYINNRKLLNEILDELKIKNTDKERVIREIDKLDKFEKVEIKENLKKYKAEKALDIFAKPEKYFEKYSSYKEIKELKQICKDYNINVEFVPYLARGLAYYNGTVFEIKTKKIKETICGGGSYLVNGIQSTGISASIERLYLLANINLDKESVLIISLEKDKEAIEIAEKIRKLNIPTTIMYGKPSKALEYANSYNISNVIFIGENEIKSGKLKLKNMLTGKENMILQKDLEKEILKI